MGGLGSVAGQALKAGASSLLSGVGARAATSAGTAAAKKEGSAIVGGLARSAFRALPRQAARGAAGTNFTSAAADNNLANVRNTGLHDVVAHGTRDGYLSLDKEITNGGQLVDAVRANPNYRSGQACRLMACHAAVSGVGRQVADELGVPVLALTDRVGTIPALGPGQEFEFRITDPGRARLVELAREAARVILNMS